MSNTKPRTSRKAKKPRSKKSSTKTGKTPAIDPTYLDHVFNAISSLSVTEQVAISLSICSLLCTAAVLRQRSNKNPPVAPKNTRKYIKLSDEGMPSSSSEGLSANIPQISATARKQISQQLLIRPTKKNKIPTEEVTKLFQRALSSKRPQQAVIADNFYQQIRGWNADQLELSGQTIVVNFLFWYYRTLNVPVNKLLSAQAEHVRYWASYTLTDQTEWGFYNIKFDYMYSAALISKSIPHMRRFYDWVVTETARAPPAASATRKQNYYLTRFQAACVLGQWPDVLFTGGELKRLCSTAKKKDNCSAGCTDSHDQPKATPGRTDYFMHYTLRALEQPASNPNFAMVYRVARDIGAEFEAALPLPPPRFSTLQVYQLRYRNLDDSVAQPQNNAFVFASQKTLDADGFYKLYPMQSALTARIPKVIQQWGSVCQMVSPLHGSAGFLPMTGVCSDTRIYMQTDWTYRVMRTQLTRKQGVLRIEREPRQQTVESRDMLGNVHARTGYLWRGTMHVYMKPLQSMQDEMSGIFRTLGDTPGGEHAAAAESDRQRDLISEADNDDDITVMVYEVELVVATQEAHKAQLEKEQESNRERLKKMMAGVGKNGIGNGNGSGVASSSEQQIRIREALRNFQKSANPFEKSEKANDKKQQGGGKSKQGINGA